ncbi:RNA polymerase sigma factor [Nubsella zeaxanthinifaciens]|uniref:RNA polymerase sigma factor n=1 Tax=Nubsella zeaxanthinifaciens TaxID=392412 RepID=UPI000DE49A1A|nr:RNA polymerase sigma-70 factor [Nubsella zeaxanthinifaciens]
MYSFKALSTKQINDFREGNEIAFKEIYVLFSPKVYAFAYSFLKDQLQSEEIVQETFLSLWENRGKFDADKVLEPYLFTIAKRQILDQLRKVISTKKLRENLLTSIITQHNDTENQVIFADMLSFANKAINELPKQQQLVFRLSRMEGLSYDEIADRLGLSKNTVKNHLIVAAKKLKTCFDNQEIIFLLCLFSTFFS